MHHVFSKKLSLSLSLNIVIVKNKGSVCIGYGEKKQYLPCALGRHTYDKSVASSDSVAAQALAESYMIAGQAHVSMSPVFASSQFHRET